MTGLVVVVVDASTDVDGSARVDDEAVDVGDAAVVVVWACAWGTVTAANMTPSATSQEVSARRTGETVPEPGPG